VTQQRTREFAEQQARIAAQTGDAYAELLAEGMRFSSKVDWRIAAKANREAIALRPDEPLAYYNLGVALQNSGHVVEAAQRYLEAMERYPVGSEGWAEATARAFLMLIPARAFLVLIQQACAEVAKPEWWNDEGLKALSARVVRAAPDDATANRMRALVLSDLLSEWAAGPRYERAAALQTAPAMKAGNADLAARCRTMAEDM